MHGKFVDAIPNDLSWTAVLQRPEVWEHILQESVIHLFPVSNNVICLQDTRNIHCFDSENGTYT